MLRDFMALAGIAFAAAGFAQEPAQTPIPFSDFLLSGNDAVAMLPVEFISGPQIIETQWSDDGLYLSVVHVPLWVDSRSASDQLATTASIRSSVPETMELLVWSAVTGKTRALMTLRPEEGKLSIQGWMPNSSTIVVQVDPMNPEPGAGPTLAVLSASNNHAPSYIRLKQGDMPLVIMSPNTGLALIQVTRLLPPQNAGPSTAPAPERAVFRVVSVRYLSSDGTVEPEIQIPTDSYASATFGPDGKTGMICSFHREPGKKVQQNWFIVDRASRTLIPSKRPGGFEQQESPQLISVENVRPGVTVSNLTTTAPTVLLSGQAAGKENKVVVSTDAESGTLSPSGNAVAYQSHGALIARRLVRVSKEAYEMVRVALLKDKAMNDAKQAGLAAIMYAMDMDDQFPKQEGFSQMILPYLKNQSIASSFTYTYAGGPMSAIAKPAEQQIGYVDGPGGRAIVFADGHVKWTPSP